MVNNGKDSVQTFGKKKTAIAVAYCKRGRGLIKVNGQPLECLEPEILRVKTYEPVLLLGESRFKDVDIRIKVKGGGYTAQVYAIRQAIAKALVAFYQKCKFIFFVSMLLLRGHGFGYRYGYRQPSQMDFFSICVSAVKGINIAKELKKESERERAT